jgi:hypothetical protein
MPDFKECNHMFLSKRYITSRLKNRLVLWINPCSISHGIGTKWPVTKPVQKKIKALPTVPYVSKKLIKILRVYHPFVIPARSYRNPFPIESHEKYAKVRDLLKCRDDITTSKWYKQLARELKTDQINFLGREPKLVTSVHGKETHRIFFTRTADILL